MTSTNIWLKWVFANGLGTILLILVVLPLFLAGDESLSFLAAILVLLGNGLAISFTQWLFFRGTLTSFSWVLISTIGWFSGLMMGQILGATITPTVSDKTIFAFVLAFAGAGIGISQRFFFRHSSLARLWIVSNLIGWALSGVLLGFVLDLESYYVVLGLSLGSIVAGTVTGLTLIQNLKTLAIQPDHD